MPNKIIQGDCLTVLKTLDTESVNCCVTSPPYYSHRAYQTAPQIWGGDENCPHEWGDGREMILNLQAGNKEFQRPWRENATSTITDGNFCHLCNAWRGELGLEPTPELYVEHIVSVFREVRRVLVKSGTLWCNLGDSYAGGGRGYGYGSKQDTNKGCENMPASIVPKGLKPKDLVGIPWAVAFALRNDGWYLRSDIIWAKGCSGNYTGGSTMPESCKDRPTKSHEYVFMFSKSANYYYDYKAIQEPAVCGTDLGILRSSIGNGNPYGEQIKNRLEIESKTAGNGLRNRRTVWVINPSPTKFAHFATFPKELVRPMIQAGCPKNGVVMDIFSGSGTTCEVAAEEGRDYIGIELKPEYITIAKRHRLGAVQKRLV